MDKFRQWMESKNESVVTEKLMVAYFNVLREKYAPPSLWTTYSMLRSTLFMYEKVDISKFSTLIGALKSVSKGYQPKKTKTLDRKDVEKFINEAPDEIYLLMKMVVVMGVMGACRCEELVSLKTTDIEDHGSVLVVNIMKTKNDRSRSFVVNGVEGKGFNGLEIYRKYTALRPSTLGEGRFFLCYRSGKCTVQPVGINTLSKIPKLMANYLKLKDAHLYTGHCFRRTSARFLSNVTDDILTIQRRERWRPPSVIETYAEEPVSNQIEIASKIDNQEDTNQEIRVKVETAESTEEATETYQFSIAAIFTETQNKP